jgi:hypothetical protein
MSTLQTCSGSVMANYFLSLLYLCTLLAFILLHKNKGVEGITKMKQDYEQQIDELYGEVGRLTTQGTSYHEFSFSDG